MKASFRTFILAGLLALGLLAWVSVKANAARATFKYPSMITFSSLPNVEMGKPFTLSGYIKTSTGVPIANKDISFTLNGNTLGQTRTDSNGYFQQGVTKIFNAGTYTIVGSTTITHDFLGSTASTSLVISPVDVRVQTVPPIPGLGFSLGGQNFVAGPDGLADIKIGVAGEYQLTVLVDQYNNPDQHIEFARWMEETYKPYQVIQVPTGNVIQVGLNVFQKVGASFVDLAGFPVDPGRIKQFTIRSAQGDQFTFTDGQLHMIPSSRVARFQEGLVATPLQYSVTSMMVDGSNVVNKSQQQFFVHPNDTWQISLILYSLSVRANDGLFGSAVGKSINLVYPDGHVQNYPFDQSGIVMIHSLARGNYQVQVMNSKGLKQVIPVALSRSQTVVINVPTDFDLIVIAGAGLFTVLGLFLIGRRRLLRPLLRRNRPAFQQIQSVPVKSKDFKITTSDGAGRSTTEGMIKWS
jgi:hypothetical protein